MSQLSIYLPPYSSDYSGVCSALFDLNCVIIIHDANCCTRNYVGYDEPRWTDTRKSTFCSGLRIMDAILGNDNKLIQQTIEVADRLKPDFIAMLGSPVPAIIGADMPGIAREIETQSGYPTLGFNTTGFAYYDHGVSSAMLALLKKFAIRNSRTIAGTINVLGLTPLDFSANQNSLSFKRWVEKGGLKVNSSFLMQTDLEQVRRAPSAALNWVVSQSGFGAAQYMKEHYGIPYVVATPCGQQFGGQVLEALKLTLNDHQCRVLSGNKAVETAPALLIVGDQVIANSLRAAIQLIKAEANVTVASFFAIQKELALAGDIFLRNERHLRDLLRSGKYYGLVADPLIIQLPAAAGLKCYPIPHPAVSSYLYWDQVPLFMGDEIEKRLQSYATSAVAG
jgi:nitrogenase molybdenum-cofactor synthesis protein NifE